MYFKIDDKNNKKLKEIAIHRRHHSNAIQNSKTKNANENNLWLRMSNVFEPLIDSDFVSSKFEKFFVASFRFTIFNLFSFNWLAINWFVRRRKFHFVISSSFCSSFLHNHNYFSVYNWLLIRFVDTHAFLNEWKPIKIYWHISSIVNVLCQWKNDCRVFRQRKVG